MCLRCVGGRAERRCEKGRLPPLGLASCARERGATWHRIPPLQLPLSIYVELNEASRKVKIESRHRSSLLGNLLITRARLCCVRRPTRPSSASHPACLGCLAWEPRQACTSKLSRRCEKDAFRDVSFVEACSRALLGSCSEGRCYFEPCAPRAKHALQATRGGLCLIACPAACSDAPFLSISHSSCTLDG